MTVYDAAMLGLVLIGMLWGAWKGAIWQAAGLISLGLGYAVAHPNSIHMAAMMPGTDPLTKRMGAMLLLYVVTSGGVFLVAWTIRSFLKKIRLEAYDRHLGMLLGGAGGAAAGLVGTLFVTSLAPDTRQVVFHSVSGKLAARGLAALESRLPAEARAELAPFWNGEEGAEIAEAAGEPDPDRPTRVALRGKTAKPHDTADDDADPETDVPLVVHHRDRDADPSDDEPAPRHRPASTHAADNARHQDTPATEGDRPRFGQRAGRWLENVGRSLTHPDSEVSDADADARSR
jgi:uncharacterized membrane protein required for colicin V production